MRSESERLTASPFLPVSLTPPLQPSRPGGFKQRQRNAPRMQHKRQKTFCVPSPGLGKRCELPITLGLQGWQTLRDLPPLDARLWTLGTPRKKTSASMRMASSAPRVSRPLPPPAQHAAAHRRPSLGRASHRRKNIQDWGSSVAAVSCASRTVRPQVL